MIDSSARRSPARASQPVKARDIAERTRGRADSMSRLGRAVEDDRVDEREANDAVFSPFNHGRDQDAALEANMNLRAGGQAWTVITHQSALRDIVDGEIEWRSVDQQLQLAAVGRHSWEAALIG